MTISQLIVGILSDQNEKLPYLRLELSEVSGGGCVFSFTVENILNFTPEYGAGSTGLVRSTLPPASAGSIEVRKMVQGLFPTHLSGIVRRNVNDRSQANLLANLKEREARRGQTTGVMSARPRRRSVLKSIFRTGLIRTGTQSFDSAMRNNNGN